ncbi:alpha/beta hydrolase [Amycolatopsis sp. NBC_00345]|uniref:alpha/beta hydrolase n=1 Tax=Amycolatopsis sp. NBC_00345 TaxID=2975955 RepID=UPI002E263EF2
MRVRNRRLLTAAVAVVVAVGVPFLVNAVSVQPGAAIVKALFELKPAVNPPPGYGELAAKVSAVRDVAVPVDGAPEAKLDVYAPKERSGAPLPMILWIHGGGFISGSKEAVGDYAVMLAANGYVVASLDYSLAPGTRYPAPVQQANAALRQLAAHAGEYGGDPAKVFVGGDSAGAQIASQTAALVTNPALASAMRLTPGLPAASLRGALLFCGLYDMKTVGDSGFPALQTFTWSYLGRRDWPDDPRLPQLSATGQVTNAYPATLLTVGDQDPFEGQGHEMVTALQRAGVEVRSRFYTGAGLGHEYQFDFSHPESNEFFRMTLDFLTERSAA